MTTRISHSLLLATVLFAVLMITTTTAANSFPFRGVSVGDALPAATLINLDDHKERPLAGTAGKPFIAVFWGADVPNKQQRAIKALTELEELRPFLSERSLEIVSVNAQNDDPARVKAVRQEAKAAGPVYTDKNQEAYGALGIFVMPSILLVDKDNKIAAGMGYSHDLAARLRGEVEIMLGEKSRQQVEEELQPKMEAKDPAEVASRRHLNMGRTMLSKGMEPAALREFAEAISQNPKNSEAYIELGCLHMAAGRLDEADANLGKGLELDPDSVRGQICDGHLTAKNGDLETGMADLQGLLMRNAANPELRFTLGTLFEEKGAIPEAAAEYKKAYELLHKKMTLH